MQASKQHFFLYSRVNSENITTNLGSPEYSYYFVHKGFRPAFEQLGDVTEVSAPEEELPALVRLAESRGQQCHFICFSPPNKSWLNLPCPITCIFAWEFDTIPDIAIDDDPMQNWVAVLAKQGQTITLSSYSSTAVANALGADFPVATIPVPINQPQALPASALDDDTEHNLTISGTVIDSRNYTANNAYFNIIAPSNAFSFPVWDTDQEYVMQFQQEKAGASFLGGFYKPEAWGCWSKTRSPWILIPRRMSGTVTIRVLLIGHGSCIGAYKVSLGNEVRQIEITGQYQWHELHFNTTEHSSVLQFHELNPVLAASASDPRTIGIGIKELQVHRIENNADSSASLPLTLNLGEKATWSSYGFHPAEDWGMWSYASEIGIILDQAVTKPVTVTVIANAIGKNVNRSLIVCMGNDYQLLTPSATFEEYSLNFTPNTPASSIVISGILPERAHENDPRELGIAIKSIKIAADETASTDSIALAACDENIVSQCKLAGFFPPDAHKLWSSDGELAIALPPTNNEAAAVQIALHGHEENYGTVISLTLGHHTISHKIEMQTATVCIPLNVQENTSPGIIIINGVKSNTPGNSGDPRSLGIAIEDIRYLDKASQQNTQALARTEKGIEVRYSGLVYTSVFNPADARKNWFDIVTAFVHVFKDNPDATLILKLTHTDLAPFLGKFHFVLHNLQPYKCRLLAVHGYLDGTDYKKLVDSTHFYVNASSCEGLCLPLIEFMDKGKPAIAPTHTAMADFVNSDNAFIVDANREPAIWPHDDRQVFTAHSYRTNWASLREAFQNSHAMLKAKPDHYDKMAVAAQHAVRQFADQKAVTTQLADFFEAK